MKPMKVDIGEYAPDVDELIEKANSMEEMLIKVASLTDDSQMRNITGVEEAPMNHYWTNQTQPEQNIESVQRQNPSTETVNLINANPHQTGSTLSAHENTAGGDMKKSIGVRKAGMPPMPPGGGGPPGGDMGGGGDADALAALLGGAGGEGGDEEGLPDDPQAIADMLMGLGKKVKALGGGGGDMPAPDMPPMGGDEGAGAGGPPNLPGM